MMQESRKFVEAVGSGEEEEERTADAVESTTGCRSYTATDRYDQGCE